MHIHLWPTKPYQNLKEIFDKAHENQENKEEFEEGRQGYNMMRQHRINVTPTLLKFTIGEEEESNRVIREFKGKLPNFLRLCFT